MEFALVKTNLVENVIVADQEFADSIKADWDAVVAIPEGNPSGVGIGWTYKSKKFTAPVVESLPEVVLPVNTKISVGAFFDRFGDQKYPILASDSLLVQALIKDCSVRKFIDLADPQLKTGLGLIVSAGFTIDVDAILTTPVGPTEGV